MTSFIINLASFKSFVFFTVALHLLPPRSVQCLHFRPDPVLPSEFFQLSVKKSLPNVFHHHKKLHRMLCLLHVIFFFFLSFSAPASWSSGNAFVSGAGGLKCKFRAGQIGRSVANGSPPLRHFFERSCVARAQ